jgi:hypothetical protein
LHFCAPSEALLVLSQASKAAKTLVSPTRFMQLAADCSSLCANLRVRQDAGTVSLRGVSLFMSSKGVVAQAMHVHTAHGTVVLTFSEYILRYVAK